MAFKTRTWLAAAVAITATTAVASSETAPADVKINDDMQVTESLTGAPGDPAAGRKTFADRKLGNCLACHAVADQSEQLFHGEVGPELNGVADRWSPEQLRAIVVNSKAIFSEDTIMPGFYSLDVGKDVRKDLVGKTILSAQQVEDVVAYLATLKE
ncbi:MAG: sulfur oxidation c-type cytochrome SoxX [Ahrensia sp.]|nr:sulfur oxidation c-type cytochrome SoxX [Ahrensia sp.]